MDKVSIIEQSGSIKVGKEPVVLMPLKLWRKFENYLEDREALASRRYLGRIRKARKDISRRKLIYPLL